MSDLTQAELERQRDLAWNQHHEQIARARGDEVYVPPHPSSAQWFNGKPKAPAAPHVPTARMDNPLEVVGTQVYWGNCWHEKHGVVIACRTPGNVKVRFNDGRVMTVKVDFLTTPPAESVAA